MGCGCNQPRELFIQENLRNYLGSNPGTLHIICSRKLCQILHYNLYFHLFEKGKGEVDKKIRDLVFCLWSIGFPTSDYGPTSKWFKFDESSNGSWKMHSSKMIETLGDGLEWGFRGLDYPSVFGTINRRCMGMHSCLCFHISLRLGFEVFKVLGVIWKHGCA